MSKLTRNLFAAGLVIFMLLFQAGTALATCTEGHEGDPIEDPLDMPMDGDLPGQPDWLSPFPDVDAGHDRINAINYLNREEVFLGAGDGNFHPDDTLNRAEFGAIVTRMVGANPDPEVYKDCFPDVGTDWYAAPVCYLYTNGYVTGYGAGELAGMYGPDQPVMDIEVLAILGRIGNWDLPPQDSGEWYQPYLDFAQDHALIPYDSPVIDIPRADTAELMFRSLVVFGELCPTLTYRDELIPDIYTHTLDELVIVDVLNGETVAGCEELGLACYETVEALGLAEDPVIETYEDQYHDFFGGETGDPQLKLPQIEWNPEETRVTVELGLAPLPETEPADVESVKVLLYDDDLGIWGYGSRGSGSTAMIPDPVDDFAVEWSILLDGMYVIENEEVKPLDNADPDVGLALDVETSDGKRFVVGKDEAVQIDGDEGIQDGADGVEKVPISDVPEEEPCACPDVDINQQLALAFAQEHTLLMPTNLDLDEWQNPLECENSPISTMIRLGRDLQVLESDNQLGWRVQTGLYRPQEPKGHFVGAHYLLFITIYDWCDSRDCKCECEFAWRIVEVETGIIKAAGFERGNCENLSGPASRMIDKIEDELDKNFQTF